MTYVYKCQKCGSALNHKVILKLMDPKKKMFCKLKEDRKRLTFCTECGEIFPRCCVCYLQITIKNPYLEWDPQRTRKAEPDEGVTSDTAIVWCQKCKHGGHYDHIVDWFSN